MFKSSISTSFSWHLKPVLAVLFLLVVLSLVYGQVQGFSFLDWDDPFMVTTNEWVRHGITVAGLNWLVSGVVAHNWHPLTNFTWMLDAQFWGDWAGGFHLTNLFLHFVASLFAWKMLRLLGLAPIVAFVGALLFALHPLRVEPVAWITGRKDLMFGVSSFAALSIYLVYRQTHQIKTYLWVTIAVTAAALSKPACIVLVPLMAWIDFVLANEGDRFRSALLRMPGKILWLALTLIPAWVTWSTHTDAGAVLTPFSGSVFDRLAYPILALGEYLRLSFWPVGLSYLHPMWQSYSVGLLILAGSLLLAISWGAWRLRGVAPGILLGWGWFLIALAPVAGFVRIGQHSVAERYTYLPHIGLVLALLALACHLAHKETARRLVIAVSVMTAMGLAIVSHGYASTWKDSMTLRERAVAVTPDHLDAQTWLAISLARNGQLEEAHGIAERLQKNASAHNSADVAYRLAQVYATLGDTEAAENWFGRSLQIHPGEPVVLMTRGSMRLSLLRYADAASDFEQVVALRPQFKQAWVGYGYTLIYLARTNEAEDSMKRASAIDPNWDEPYFHLGYIAEKRGDLDQALSLYQETLVRNPWHQAAKHRLEQIRGAS